MKPLAVVLLGLWSVVALAADIVPNEVQMPGTQPNEVGNFESPDRCDNCHAGYALDPEDEPATGWRGSAMGNAGRDPVFWATLAVAEQDFDGSGDLCIRCHSTGGWYAGRSTPTDGSGLFAGDDDGVDCDTCHTMTNTGGSEHAGVMNSPFIANCSDDDIANNSCASTSEGYYGSGMLSLWSGSDKLGPYADADARHQFLQSDFHRSVDFCGSCHDVSNPVVGDLAPGHGAQPGNPHGVIFSGVPGGSIDGKAAFNNPPYAYGVVERTFSEYKASAFPTLPVSQFDSLPGDLKAPGGSLESTYQAALLAGTGGDFADGSTRYFSCQSCHMRPANAKGCNKAGVQTRGDLARHDLTGGNYWFADVAQYQDARDQLRLGGGLTGTQLLAMDLGKARAAGHLRQAAALSVTGDTLKVVNLTGHKLISGYPEGRRMWLNTRWMDGDGNLLREDGAYGPLTDGSGNPIMVANPAGGQAWVESILDLEDPNTKIYEAHYAMTQEWAASLTSLGYSVDLPLSFDRYTGAVDYTLGQLAAQAPGTYHETFHFVLNDLVAKDNRIPPYGMSYDEAQKRNALPVPADQYGNPGAGGVYEYWDEVSLNPPAGAIYAEIDLLYQGTSWEYIQFLDRANTGQNAFLGVEGQNMLEAWINAEVPMGTEVAGDRKMVPPVVMASATWGTPPVGGGNTAGVASVGTGYYQTTGTGKSKTTVFVSTDTITRGDTLVLRSLVRDGDGNPLAGAAVTTAITGPESATVTSAASDANGIAEATWSTSAPNRKGVGGTATGSYTATTVDVTAEGYTWDGAGTGVSFTVQ